MCPIYNHDTFLLFLGGFFSLILPVFIAIAKRQYARRLEKDRLEKQKKIDPESVGNIEAKLDDFGYKKIDFFAKMTEWGLQPLFIICFVNLFNSQGVIEVTIVFALILFMLLHEFWTGNEYSEKIGYQLLMLGCWIGLFFLISFCVNTHSPPSEITNKDIPAQTQDSTNTKTDTSKLK